MAGEISSNNGYFALKRETAPGTTVIPDRYVPLYDESFSTSLNPSSNNSIFGSKFARLLIIPGIRSHGGEFTVMAEPNSSEHLHDMLLTKGTTTGAGPYTTPFGVSFTNPYSYTCDFSVGNQVMRFSGVAASDISPTWEGNEMRWKVKASALKSFIVGEISGAVTTVVTLKTTNNPVPTRCLLATDLVSVVNQTTGARQDFTIISVSNTTVTLSGSPTGVIDGDMLILRPATPSLSVLSPFLWSRTEFRFGVDAATALGAIHTPVEKGSEWSITHAFEEDSGAQSSGDFDPATLVRTNVDAPVKVKVFFKDPLQARNYTGYRKVALVIRCFSETAYEFRLTLNNLRITKGGDKPMLKADEILYYELEYLPTYDQTDAQALAVITINAVAAL